MPLKILVCIKQVPNVAAMKLDPATKTLVRDKVPLEVSSFDLRALLKAVELVKQHGGETVAVTMGPPQAAKALEHCLALGADRAIHLTDRAFAGADTLATARALALAARAEKPDLVFCGRYSTDSETGQVGPELAELLDLPQATAARSISIAGATATIERETDEGYETLEVTLPCVITAAEDLAPERFPSKKDREAAKTKSIKAMDAAAIGADAATVGLAGSPTWVKDIVTLPNKRACTFVDSAAKLADAIRGALKSPRATATAGSGRTPGSGPEVWVVAEILGGAVRPVTFELLGKGAELAATLGGPLVAILLGSAKHAADLAAHGADRVHVADLSGPYRTEPHAAVLAAAIRAAAPHSVLLPSTSMGRDLAPRVAARLGLGLTGDAIDLRLDAEKRLVMDKPAFGGNIIAPILSKTAPAMATVRPGLLKAAAADRSRAAKIVALPAADPPSRTKVLSVRTEGAGEAARLDTAGVVVGVGMGIGGPENLPAIRALAAVLDAPLATTRDCTDKGWLPRQHQVGLTGRCIAPRVYLAIGIRGAFEHTVGIQKAGTILSINPDEQAMIWDSTDVGLKGDWKEIVPALVTALKS